MKVGRFGVSKIALICRSFFHPLVGLHVHRFNVNISSNAIQNVFPPRLSKSEGPKATVAVTWTVCESMA